LVETGGVRAGRHVRVHERQDRYPDGDPCDKEQPRRLHTGLRRLISVDVNGPLEWIIEPNEHIRAVLAMRDVQSPYDVRLRDHAQAETRIILQISQIVRAELGHDSSHIQEWRRLDVDRIVEDSLLPHSDPLLKIQEEGGIRDKAALAERAERRFTAERRPFIKRGA